MNEKLLLVDDEEDIRDVLSISLSDIGYDVYTAENGEEALRVFMDVRPAIVLSDIRMPVMDGIELLQKIKAESKDVEVIMISGHGDMDLAIKSLRYEATDFITKPVNDELLQMTLKRAGERIVMRTRLREYTENLEELVREKSAKLVEAERLIAVGQVVEGLSSAMKNIIGDTESSITYFNEMPCFVSIHSQDLEVLATNQLYTERLGNRIGNKSWEIYSDKTKSRETCPVFKTFEKGKGQRSREIITDIAGNDIPVIVYTAPIRNKDQDVELVLEISADIMEVNRLQEELRTTQQRYHQLFNEVPCFISVQDKDLKVVDANRRFKEAFQDDIGSYCYDVYKHRNDPCPECPVIRTFEEEKSQQSETVVTSKTGEQYNVLIHTSPIRNAAGEVTQVMEMSANITEIRKLQDRLTSLGLLLGSTSHAVKGMLTGLDGGLYWLDTGIKKENPERIKKGYEVIKLSAERIKNIVLNLLYYTKDRELNWKMIPISGFAKDVAAIVDSKMGLHQIDFIHDFYDDLGEFEVDPNLLSSALTNILENAVDACIEDRSKKRHKITFQAKKDEDHIHFDVYDNGIGMDTETRENSFTLFFSSKGSKGTGLGLFVANEIVLQHGGSITVESTAGKGSHFNVILPEKRPDPVEPTQGNQG